MLPPGGDGLCCGQALLFGPVAVELAQERNEFLLFGVAEVRRELRHAGVVVGKRALQKSASLVGEFNQEGPGVGFGCALVTSGTGCRASGEA